MDREHQIALGAQRVALTHFPNGRVEPEVIATREGIAFRYASFSDEFDGALFYKDGRFYIVCNDRRAERGSARSRFTFAHELGHYFIADHREALASGRVPQYYSLAEYASSQPVERECDLFAANLLMPAQACLERAGKFPRGLTQVAALASFYGTSVTSAAYRALDLALFPAPAAVFRWDAQGRQIGRRMSFETYYSGTDYRQLVTEAPEPSATAVAIRDRAQGRFHRPSDCMAWFDGFLYSDEPGNLPLCEEVMSLGKFGWLTLVYLAEANSPSGKT